MEYLRLKIRPISSFATEPASDTLFGQICYTLSLMNEDINTMLADYETDPFLVVSDLFPLGYALKPVVPLKPADTLNIENLVNRKKDKEKNRILLDGVITSGRLSEEYISAPVWKIISNDATHVNINRLTGTTSKGAFAPYNLIDYYYSSLKEDDTFTFDLYLYVKEEYKSAVLKAIELIGKTGYGKKTTIGKGRFIVDNLLDIETVNIDTADKNSLFTLGRCCISGFGSKADAMYYTPNTKFGKHGVITADGIPFKSPYVTAEQGMILLNIKDKAVFNKPYIGKAITDISHRNNTVSQGYSLYIPFII